MMSHSFMFLLLEASSLFQDDCEGKFQWNISGSNVWQAGSILKFSTMREGKAHEVPALLCFIFLQRPRGKKDSRKCDML